MPSFEEFLETYQTPAQTGRTLAQANEFANPQEAATALTTARKAGLPPEITDLDPIGFKRRQQQDENARILSYNDGLSSFIAENPVAGKAINDDYEKLDAFSKTLNAVKTGWHRGIIGEKLGFVGSQDAAGLGGEEQVPELERRSPNTQKSKMEAFIMSKRSRGCSVKCSPMPHSLPPVRESELPVEPFRRSGRNSWRYRWRNSGLCCVNGGSKLRPSFY
jgi:hypothetical protein